VKNREELCGQTLWKVHKNESGRRLRGAPMPPILIVMMVVMMVVVMTMPDDPDVMVVMMMMPDSDCHLGHFGLRLRKPRIIGLKHRHRIRNWIK
jgi:hypothetical protein